ncbi:MAG: GNAT family N-acetyltransferase [Mucilaginibacter sp.]
MYENIPLINDQPIHNFELIVDGHRAFIDYQQRGDKYFLIHTEVPVDLEGHGVAMTLVEKTLTYIETNNGKIVPYCAYIKAFLKRHPEWERLVA